MQGCVMTSRRPDATLADLCETCSLGERREGCCNKVARKTVQHCAYAIAAQGVRGTACKGTAISRAGQLT
eukprot:7377011-Prymnesium_polylepis.5